MSKITFEEFEKRFELTKQYRSEALLKRNQYRDRLHRRNCISLEYLNLTEESRNKIFDQFSRLYNPNYSLQLSCYTERVNGLKCDLIFILDECDTLTKHLWDEKKGKVLTLDFKEILYLFKRIAQILSYYHGLGYNHGDITEGSIYIDQGKQVRMMFFPKRRTNMEKAAQRTSSGQSLQHTGYLLSPEQFDLLINRNEAHFDPSECNIDKYKNDVFSLGLMILRIVSPEAFYQGYDLANMEVEMKRLYTLVDTLGVFINNHFMAMIRDCLSFDQRFRPTANFLLTEMEVFANIETKLKDKPRERIEEESFLMHQDLYTGDHVANPYEDMSASIPLHSERSFNPSKIKRVDISHNFGPQLETIRSKLAPKRFSFKKNIGNLQELKTECLHFIENDIYGNLAHRKAMHKPYGELTYKVKILNNNKKAGFILYPNGDIYFGYLRDLKRDDIGIYFLANGEVYHGEFRKGKIEGTGTYIFKNGDVFDGQWKENLLHGPVKMYQKKSGDHYVCKFQKGHLASKTKNNLDVINNIGLGEFYKSFIMKTLIIRELTKNHILVNTERLELNRQIHRTKQDSNQYVPDKDKFDKFNQLSDAYLDMVSTAGGGKKPPKIKIVDAKVGAPGPSTNSSRRRKKKKQNPYSNREEFEKLKGKKDFNLEDFDMQEDGVKTLPNKMKNLKKNGSRDSLRTNKKKSSRPNTSRSGSRKSRGRKKSKSSKNGSKKSKKIKSKKSTKSTKKDYKCLVNLKDEDYDYEGGKKDGKFDGFGHFYFKNGCRFYGNFINGLANGKGTFFEENGQHKDGVWINGLFQEREDNFSYDADNSDEDNDNYLGIEELEGEKDALDELDTPAASDEEKDVSKNKLLDKYAVSSDSDEESGDDYLLDASDEDESD